MRMPAQELRVKDTHRRRGLLLLLLVLDPSGSNPTSRNRARSPATTATGTSRGRRRREVGAGAQHGAEGVEARGARDAGLAGLAAAVAEGADLVAEAVELGLAVADEGALLAQEARQLGHLLPVLELVDAGDVIAGAAPQDLQLRLELAVLHPQLRRPLRRLLVRRLGVLVVALRQGQAFLEALRRRARLLEVLRELRHLAELRDRGVEERFGGFREFFPELRVGVLQRLVFLSCGF